ncbi:MAG: 2Fe-2S iron-sulfur cluster-binding protein [Ilumatobacteraceae bacterium]
MSIDVTLTVNGVDYPVTIDQGRNLLSVIRTEIGLTGTKEGCDDCECGACMVLLDGQPVNSCSYLAAQAQGGPSPPWRAWPTATPSTSCSATCWRRVGSSAGSAPRAC